MNQDPKPFEPKTAEAALLWLALEIEKNHGGKSADHLAHLIQKFEGQGDQEAVTLFRLIEGSLRKLQPPPSDERQ